MRYPRLNLNEKQLEALANVCFDIGKAIFLASVAAFLIPTLVQGNVTFLVFITGLLISLTLIISGIILLRGKKV